MNLSGSAVRTSSVFGSHWSLRTRVSCFLRVYVSILYGPVEIGRLSYWVLVSLATGTGEKLNMDAVASNSAIGRFSLNTIVLSSGVSIASQPLPPLLPPIYGPLYDWQAR